MHWLASDYRAEFLATPQLVRMEFAEGDNGREPTLLIKGSTLLLKYIVQGSLLRFCFSLVEGRLLYALQVYDDDEPAMLWSLLEREEEKLAFMALARGEPCVIFLFNELAVNVAWSSSVTGNIDTLKEMVKIAPLGSADYEKVQQQILDVLDQSYNAVTGFSNLILADLPNIKPWKSLSNSLVTLQGATSPIELFDKDEGGQQEQLAVWLTDNLHPAGAHFSPQIPKGKVSRELTDILLSHQYGAILIESKALTIFGRDHIPSRQKLARNLNGHVKKAIGQLKGAIRQIKLGAIVSSATGNMIEVERDKSPHGIVMIPEFALIEDRREWGAEIMQNFMSETGGFLHILDVAELLRIVQAAEIISSRSENLTPMMAFDYYLCERAEKAYKAGSLCIEVLLRMSDAEK